MLVALFLCLCWQTKKKKKGRNPSKCQTDCRDDIKGLVSPTTTANEIKIWPSFDRSSAAQISCQNGQRSTRYAASLRERNKLVQQSTTHKDKCHQNKQSHNLLLYAEFLSLSTFLEPFLALRKIRHGSLAVCVWTLERWLHIIIQYYCAILPLIFSPLRLSISSFSWNVLSGPPLVKLSTPN